MDRKERTQAIDILTRSLQGEARLWEIEEATFADGEKMACATLGHGLVIRVYRAELSSYYEVNVSTPGENRYEALQSLGEIPAALKRALRTEAP